MTYHAQVTETGAVILPPELAEELGLVPGRSLTIDREDGKLVLKSFEQVVRDVQAEFRAMIDPARRGSIVDELIADRHAEAAQEDADHETWLRSPDRR